MVGFPGETEAAFRNTCDLIAQSPLVYLHVFPYSPRNNTPAVRMDGQVDPKVKKRYGSEKDALRNWLHPNEKDGGATRRRVRAAILFIISYRELPLLAWPRELLDGIIEMEQHFLIFRQRHARMVERIIGRRTGTGGSAGVDYIDQTALTYRIFEDLWTVRTFQMREATTPKLDSAEFYQFRNQ